MKIAKPKRSSARLPRLGPSNWRERVEPAFVAHYSAMKRNHALGDMKNEREAARTFHKEFRELATASRALIEAKRVIREPIAEKIRVGVLKQLDIELPRLTQLASGASMQIEPGTGTYAQNPESSTIFRLLVFLKYGITFRELIHQIDIEKNSIAHRRLMAIHRDYWRFLSGTQLKDLKLKFSQHHFAIMTDGFDFGLDKLTPDELADCLDEICPCGQTHSPAYYKKLRAWIKQASNRVF